MFSGFVKTDELMPLYSTTKYIEFGSFFRKLDSIYLLIWIITFIGYLSITLKFSSNILKKLTNSENELLYIILLAICVLIVSLFSKNFTVSTYYSNIVYKYAFFILVIGASFLILFFASLKKALRRWIK